MNHRIERLTPLDVATYVREMSNHLASMARETGLPKLAGVLDGAAWIAAEEAGRISAQSPSLRKAAADDAP